VDPNPRSLRSEISLSVVVTEAPLNTNKSHCHFQYFFRAGNECSRIEFAIKKGRSLRTCAPQIVGPAHPMVISPPCSCVGHSEIQSGNIRAQVSPAHFPNRSLPRIICLFSCLHLHVCCPVLVRSSTLENLVFGLLFCCPLFVHSRASPMLRFSTLRQLRVRQSQPARPLVAVLGDLAATKRHLQYQYPTKLPRQTQASGPPPTKILISCIRGEDRVSDHRVRTSCTAKANRQNDSFFNHSQICKPLLIVAIMYSIQIAHAGLTTSKEKDRDGLPGQLNDRPTTLPPDRPKQLTNSIRSSGTSGKDIDDNAASTGQHFVNSLFLVLYCLAASTVSKAT